VISLSIYAPVPLTDVVAGFGALFVIHEKFSQDSTCLK
jgi:hypothetical protein